MSLIRRSDPVYDKLIINDFSRGANFSVLIVVTDQCRFRKASEAARCRKRLLRRRGVTATSRSQDGLERRLNNINNSRLILDIYLFSFSPLFCAIQADDSLKELSLSNLFEIKLLIYFYFHPLVFKEELFYWRRRNFGNRF